PVQFRCAVDRKRCKMAVEKGHAIAAEPERRNVIRDQVAGERLQLDPDLRGDRAPLRADQRVELASALKSNCWSEDLPALEPPGLAVVRGWRRAEESPGRGGPRKDKVGDEAIALASDGHHDRLRLCGRDR